VYSREFTDEDWKRAEDWAKGAIAIIEKGDFEGGLDPITKKCDGSCGYGKNCWFA
jgi:hypothetical protein